MEELRKGIQHLEEDRLVKEAQRLEKARLVKEAAEEKRSADEPEAVRQGNVEAERTKSSLFASTLATLGRLSSSYRRCYWKSGAETIFPILFNHLTFASHRCWKLYTKKAVFFAQEVWRKQYGPGLLLAHREAAAAETIIFKRSGCDDYTLKGWFKTMNKDAETGQEYVLFIGPQGQRCFSITEAFDADQDTKSKDLKPRQQLSLLQDLLLRSATFEDAVPQTAAPASAQKHGEHTASSSLRELQSSGQDVPVDATQLQTPSGAMPERTMTVTTTSLEDYAWRGDHPLLKDMSWSTYGMWVYRIEVPPRAEVSVRSAVARFVDIYFASDYKLASTHMQRISTEPRVPMFEGFTMPPVTTDAERNAMYKQLQCRPFSVPRGDQTPEEKMLEAFKPFCAMPPPGQPHDLSLWASAAFSKAFVEWHSDVKKQTYLAAERFLRRFEYPSLWETHEMQETLSELCDEWQENHDEFYGGSDPEAALRFDPDADHPRCTVEQYSCLLASERVGNLEGICRARLEKHQKRRDLDAQVHEEYSRIATTGENPEYMPDAHPEDDAAGTTSAADVLKQFFPPIRHRPDADEQRKLLQFQMRSRNSAFAKEFMSLPMMQSDVFQAAESESTTSMLGRTRLASLRQITTPFTTMSTQERRQLLHDHQERLNPQNAEDLENDVFTSDHARVFLHKILPDIPADCCAFSEQGVYATPSALIKDLVQKLPENQRLNEDQTLFIARFAQVCDQAYEDRTKPPKERRVHHLLLLGQGGSGKTHVVQNLVFVAALFIWPPTHGETMHVVAASNAQAKNISTTKVKARTLHSACCMRVQKMVNSLMSAGNKEALLQQRWEGAMVLIIEEISMVAASLYNMLDWRIMLGRKLGHDVTQSTYSHVGCAFGRIPIVIHLGDFLQLKPTGQMSLVDDIDAKNPDGSWKYANVSTEVQHAQKLFCSVPDVFELRGTMRFVSGDPIIDFLQCMRRGGTFPPEVWTAFEDTFAKDAADCPDTRHAESRFAEGFGMGIYWESLSRMISRRAVMDARKLGVPLLLAQCADECNDMEKDVAFRFLNQLNPHNTGHMHGILPVHIGMRLRLLARFNADLGLVQETCCTVVDFELHEQDRLHYDNCPAGQRQNKSKEQTWKAWPRM